MGAWVVWWGIGGIETELVFSVEYRVMEQS